MSGLRHGSRSKIETAVVHTELSLYIDCYHDVLEVDAAAVDVFDGPFDFLPRLLLFCDTELTSLAASSPAFDFSGAAMYSSTTGGTNMRRPACSELALKMLLIP